MENTKTKRLSTKSMVLCAMFTALVAVGAFIQIPVPYMDYFTLQFFFVLLAGLILGGNKGAISVGCYVLLGLIGIPIFAAGGGIGYIFRPSFGYAHTPATIAVIFLSCFPLDMPGDFVLCLLASGVGLKMRKNGFCLNE